MKKRIKNSLMILSSLSTLTAISSFLISCNDPKKDPKNDNKQDGTQTDVLTPQNPDNPNQGSNKTTDVKESYNAAEIKEFIQGKTFDQLFQNTITIGPRNATLPSEVQGNVSDQAISSKDEKLPFNVINTIPNDENGTLSVVIKYGDKDNTDDSLTKTYELLGFKKQPKDPFAHINKPTVSESYESKYYKSDNATRYDLDMEEYYKTLSRQNYAHTDLNNPESGIAKYNEIAKKLNLPNYDQANKLGYTLPVYDQQGNVTGLKIKEQNGPGIGPSWFDFFKDRKPAETIGLARTITNENYATQALQTFQLNFVVWQYSADENIRLQLREAFKNDEDLKLLLASVKDAEFKKEMEDKLSGLQEGSVAIFNIYKDEIWKQLVKEYSPNDPTQTEAAKIYTKYTLDQRQKVMDRVNKLNIPEEIKKKVENNLKEVTDFYRFQESYRSNLPSAGTAWILDYELDETGKYPTKWYFGTNLHVIDGYSAENLYSLSLNRLNEQFPSIFNQLKLVNLESKIDKINFNPQVFRKVFDGRDVLNWDPKKFSVNKNEERKEYMDFAVFEIDFSKVDQTHLTRFSDKNEFAKWVTNNYANLPNEKKLKIANYDYLNSFEKIDAPVNSAETHKLQNKTLADYDSLYVLGYPKSSSQLFSDFFLKPYINDDQLANIAHDFTLWTNADNKFYDSPSTQPADKLNRGNWLSANIGLRTFKDKPGVTDRFISIPVIADKPYKSKYDSKEYFESGLSYSLKWYSPGGGASGSSVRNQNNELVGLVSTRYYSAFTSSAVAIRSNGFNYNGLYGEYNSPQYDLVYGGGKDQQNSYRQELAKLGIKKTWLFQNGLDDANIPETHKFK
ncbi:Ig-specific serine endopeptidase MIP [Mycoplasma leonicaptivi]|uniref:Ig-specific serine endopeptidase MIP n=1 Tax=Mycoplasma leonicaptivi TaxID=36742 RepID=UPI000688DAFC|nr:DUF31 family protein [Mycoplasma leonicaptivi]